MLRSYSSRRTADLRITAHCVQLKQYGFWILGCKWWVGRFEDGEVGLYGLENDFGDQLKFSFAPSSIRGSVPFEGIDF